MIVVSPLRKLPFEYENILLSNPSLHLVLNLSELFLIYFLKTVVMKKDEKLSNSFYKCPCLLEVIYLCCRPRVCVCVCICTYVHVCDFSEVLQREIISKTLPPVGRVNSRQRIHRPVTSTVSENLEHSFLLGSLSTLLYYLNYIHSF